MLASALLASARTEEAIGTDARIAAAVALGWHLAALAHPRVETTAAAAGGAAVAGLAALTESRALEYCVRHVTVAVGRLAEIVRQANLELPGQMLEECLAATEASARRAKAGEVDAKAFAILSAVDVRLGKGYGVARALMNLTTRPSAKATLEEWLIPAPGGPHRRRARRPELGAPAPRRAQRARVARGVVRLGTGARPADPARARVGALSRQGMLWQTVLTGEMQCRDALEIEDYVDAAGRLSKRLRMVAGRVMLRFWWLVLLVVALFVPGVVLLLAPGAGDSAVAGAASLLASLGLSWRAVGASIGRVAGWLEGALWGADVAVTQAVTLIEREQGRHVSARRRRVAIALQESRDA